MLTKEQSQALIPTKEQLQSLWGIHLHSLRTRVLMEMEAREAVSSLKKQHEKAHKAAESKAKEDKRQTLNKNVRFLNMPTNSHFANNLDYLPYLLKQKWGYLFNSPSYSQEKRFYVYAHVDTSKINVHITRDTTLPGIPFYIGKGSGGRAFDLNRNQGHGIKIRELLHANHAPTDIVYIIREGLTESDALELESKLIFFFGTIYTETRKKGVLYNLDMGKTPEMDNRRFIVRRKKEGIKKPTRNKN